MIPAVLEQQIEGAALLWLRRDRGVGEPHYALADLARLDGQLEAHLDGLCIAEAAATGAAWEVCERDLHWEEPGEVFVAAVLAVPSTRQERLQKVLDLAATSYELSRPLVSALGWLPWEQVVGLVDRCVHDETEMLRQIGVAALAAHRQDPGGTLAEWVHQPRVLPRAQSLRAAGELGRLDLLEAARQHLSDNAFACRFAAAWSVAVMSADAAAVGQLQRIVESGGDRSARALQLAVRRLDVPECKAWLTELAAQDPNSARMAVMGAGFLGIVDFVPWLLEHMMTPALSRVAGEAFTMITGVDLAYVDLEGDWPAGFLAGPTEDPADSNVEMDLDENLPWPNVHKIHDWWLRHRGEFEPSVRYLCGKPLGEEWLEQVLRFGRQRQRAAAALELTIRRPGQPLFNVRAPGYRQQEWLGLK